MKNKTIYKFPKNGYYSLKFPEMPLRITISCDGSNAIISTNKKLSLLYFRKLFNKEKPRKMLKQEYCDLYKNIGPIEMHPFFDEKEYLAGAYENSIFVLKVSKNSININDAKKMTNQHWDNIRFLAWQYKQNGLLASTSSDKIINLYDIKSVKNPVSKILDDDVVKSIKFSNVNFSHLATGYDKRIKIWDLKKSTISPFLVKEIFEGAVDILEWHMTQNHLLCGSKQNNVIKVFSVKDSLELILELKIKDVDEKYENSQKIIKAYFIQGNGLVAVCERKAFLYHLGNNYSEAILDQIVEFESTISNFKIMTNNLNNHYFVYTDKENNFITRQYTFDETITLDKSFIQNQVLVWDKDRSLASSTGKKLLFTKEIDNIKRKYPTNVLVENKSDRNVYIFKLTRDLITIKIKITYKENYPLTLPTVDFENKYESFLIDRSLISNINNEILHWQQNSKSDSYAGVSSGILEKLVTSLMKILDSARIQIEEHADDNAKRLLKKQGKVVTEQVTILPYVRTCSFTWGPKGQLLTFHYNKIDFKQLKPSDKTITNFNNLEDWIKFCDARDDRHKFSRSENKLIEEDYDITDLVITEKLRSLVDWKSIFELDDNSILNSINRVDSLPNLFINNPVSNSADTLQEQMSKQNKNLFTNYTYQGDLMSEIFVSSGAGNNLLSSGGGNSDCNANIIPTSIRKKSLLTIYQFTNLKDSFILENLKIKLLSKDHFFASINFLLQAMGSSEVTYLLDVLNIINFNINSIIDPSNSSELLVKHYKNAIMTCIKTLERNKNYEYLYICILLITSRIFDNVIRDVLKVPSLVTNKTDLLTKKDYTYKEGILPVLSAADYRKSIKFIRTEIKRRGKHHKKSEHSLGSERIIPTRVISHNRIYPSPANLDKSATMKSSYSNTYKLQKRSSSFEKLEEDSNKFDSEIYDENSEYQLNNDVIDRGPNELTTYIEQNQSIEEENEYERDYVEVLDWKMNGEKNDTCLSTNPPRDLILVFGDNILSKFIDFLYFYSNELYRLNRMTERAELVKFLFLISSKLKINKFKKIIENSYISSIPNHQYRNRRIYSTSYTPSETSRELDSLFNRFKAIDEKHKKKIFKTRLIKQSVHSTCDVCDERLKIGAMSIFSPYFNMKGHVEHINEYIQNVYRMNIQSLSK